MSLSTLPKTSFAPAERVSFQQIQAQAALLETRALLPVVLSQLPCPMLVTNAQRQVVLANRALLDLLKVTDPKAILGLRIGEVFNCPRSGDTLGGCGTTKGCWGCGVTTTIVAALEKGNATSPCRIGGRGPDEPETTCFNEIACSFECEGERFVLVVLAELQSGCG
jgi:hypothetical protein